MSWCGCVCSCLDFQFQVELFLVWEKERECILSRWVFEHHVRSDKDFWPSGGNWWTEFSLLKRTGSCCFSQSLARFSSFCFVCMWVSRCLCVLSVVLNWSFVWTDDLMCYSLFIWVRLSSRALWEGPGWQAGLRPSGGSWWLAYSSCNVLCPWHVLSVLWIMESFVLCVWLYCDCLTDTVRIRDVAALFHHCYLFIICSSF